MTMPAEALPTTPPASLLADLVRSDLRRVDAAILRLVENEVSLIQQLAGHIIAAGGKRLRPALTIASAQLCGYEGDRHINLATCVEFIHTATLLHDDVVDDSKLRRGLATANAIWGNKASVLVGDFLLSRAFQMMVDDGDLNVLRLLSDTSATIAQGEVQQIMITSDPATPEATYFSVIQAKTAALFAAACKLGAMAAGHQAHEQALFEYGMNLGIAFQLVDDALDYAAEQSELGKTVGDDFREGKVTLPVILAYGQATAQERAFWERTLAEGEQHEEDLATALRIMRGYNAIEQTLNRAESYAQEAKRALLRFQDTPARDALMETAEQSSARRY